MKLEPEEDEIAMAAVGLGVFALIGFGRKVSLW